MPKTSYQTIFSTPALLELIKTRKNLGKNKVILVEILNFNFKKWFYFVPLFGLFYFFIDHSKAISGISKEWIANRITFWTNALFLITLPSLLISLVINILPLVQKLINHLAIYFYLKQTKPPK